MTMPRFRAVLSTDDDWRPAVALLTRGRTKVRAAARGSCVMRETAGWPARGSCVSRETAGWPAARRV